MINASYETKLSHFSHVIWFVVFKMHFARASCSRISMCFAQNQLRVEIRMWSNRLNIFMSTGFELSTQSNQCWFEFACCCTYTFDLANKSKEKLVCFTGQTHTHMHTPYDSWKISNKYSVMWWYPLNDVSPLFRMVYVCMRKCRFHDVWIYTYFPPHCFVQPILNMYLLILSASIYYRFPSTK